MSVISHAIRTVNGTYFLDEARICRWAMASAEQNGPEVKACVGARFVACFDPRGSGGLLEHPQVGACMLFARGDETETLPLLQTSPIDNIESHRGAVLQRRALRALGPLPQFPLPPEPGSPPRAALADLETIDPDDLVAYEETESSLTPAIGRCPPPPVPPPRRRSPATARLDGAVSP